MTDYPFREAEEGYRQFSDYMTSSPPRYQEAFDLFMRDKDIMYGMEVREFAGAYTLFRENLDIQQAEEFLSSGLEWIRDVARIGYKFGVVAEGMNGLAEKLRQRE
jgi:hypothetical protein